MLGLFLLFYSIKIVVAAEIDMAEVQEFSKLPVDAIFAGTPVVRITEDDFSKKVQECDRPVVTFFYVNREKRSKNLATLIRYLAIHFNNKISFYAYKVGEKSPVGKEISHKLKKDYCLNKVPGVFFYERGQGPSNFDHQDESQPTLKEYRIPSMFFWKTYYNVVEKHINRALSRRDQKMVRIIALSK